MKATPANRQRTPVYAPVIAAACMVILGVTGVLFEWVVIDQERSWAHDPELFARAPRFAGLMLPAYLLLGATLALLTGAAAHLNTRRLLLGSWIIVATFIVGGILFVEPFARIAWGALRALHAPAGHVGALAANAALAVLGGVALIATGRRVRAAAAGRASRAHRR